VEIQALHLKETDLEGFALCWVALLVQQLLDFDGGEPVKEAEFLVGQCCFFVKLPNALLY
jgi:hypothetical protein